MYPEAMKATFQIENPTYHSKVRPALYLRSIISFILVCLICDCNLLCCVIIPENNHSPLQKGWEIPRGRAQREREREREKEKKNVRRKIGISTGEVGS